MHINIYLFLNSLVAFRNTDFFEKKKSKWASSVLKDMAKLGHITGLSRPNSGRGQGQSVLV